MKKHKLLLIDDDKELAELLSDYLATEGFELICCYDGISGLESAFDNSISLIMLDVMMPGLTGFEVLNTLPDWYQYLLFIAVSSSFGIKGVGQAMKLMGKK